MDLTAVWNDIAEERHQQIISGDDISLTRLLLPKFIDIIEAHPNHSKLRAIEIGCGSGYLTKELSTLFAEIIGIDPSEKSTEIASNYLAKIRNTIIYTTDLEKYALENQARHEFAISNMVFQCIEDLPASLSAVHAILVNEGFFTFSIPHPKYWPKYKLLDNDPDFKYDRESKHFVPFTITNDRAPLNRPVPYFHRPVEKYIQEITKAGFVIKTESEPFPSNEIMKLYKAPWPYPHFLLFECQKME
jgi:trans-aconitate methyltransferase